MLMRLVSVRPDGVLSTSSQMGVFGSPRATWSCLLADASSAFRFFTLSSRRCTRPARSETSCCSLLRFGNAFSSCSAWAAPGCTSAALHGRRGGSSSVGSGGRLPSPEVSQEPPSLEATAPPASPPHDLLCPPLSAATSVERAHEASTCPSSPWVPASSAALSSSTPTEDVSWWASWQQCEPIRSHWYASSAAPRARPARHLGAPRPAEAAAEKLGWAASWP
mmetsp:Transcript_109334/g.352972  ORF Transcript_109334/g.352972 Transcript_109334/m.352972 type:complete len:222 (+) Transcript_109334:41-706(+)